MVIPFVQDKSLLTTNANLYFGPRPEKKTEVENTNTKTDLTSETKAKNNKLIFYINHITHVQWFCISPKVVTKIIAIAHENGHLGFNKCYKAIVRLWYV